MFEPSKNPAQYDFATCEHMRGFLGPQRTIDSVTQSSVNG